MPYIGRGPAKSGAFRILDDVSGSFNGSTTSFALTVGSTALTVGLPETLLIAVDGVVQEAGTAYTISGSNIVFTAAPQESATFWGVELGDVGGLADRATTQSASDDSTKVATTAYVDNQIDVQLTAEDLDVTGDSGTIAIDLDSEALAITGGTGITTTASGNAVNIVGHAEAHTVASHSDTTGTGAEVETLTDGSNAESLHTHTHTVVSHSDTTATGAELETLTDGSTTALHVHAARKLDDLATPDDNTDLDSSTSAHGLLRKLDNSTTNFLRGDGAWAAATTSFIGIRVENSSNQSIANNSSVNIVFDASVTKFDTDTMHVSGNADRVTFTTAGKYWVGITYAYAGNSTGRRNVTCNKNGSVPLARQTITPATADEQHNGFNFIYEFSAGDYVVFTAHQNSGSALNIMADNENATVAMAYKIG